MTVTQLMDEYRAARKQVELERDILRELLIDQIQFNNNMTRERAASMVDQELFQKMQRAAEPELIVLPPYCAACRHRHVLDKITGAVGPCGDFCDCEVLQ